MSGEQLDAREKHLEARHLEQVEEFNKERQHRAERWPAVREKRMEAKKLQASGGVVDAGAYAAAMMLLDGWRPSADWEDGLEMLRKAAGEPRESDESNG